MRSASASASDRSCRSSRRSRSSRGGGMQHSGSRGGATLATGELKKIPQELRTVRRQNAFRMKLHAFNQETSLPHAHDLSLGRACVHFKLGGHFVGGSDE